MKRILIAMTLLAMCCGSVFAAVGLEPASGYVHLPNAQVEKTGNVDAYAAYLTTDGTNELFWLSTQAGPCNGNGYKLGAVGGIGKNFELGAGYTSISSSIGTPSAYTIASKWQFYNQCRSGVSMALGANYSNWDSNMQTSQELELSSMPSFSLPAVTSVYLALDKNFKPTSLCSFTGTIGAIWNSYSSSESLGPLGIGGPFGMMEIPDDSFLSPFVGIKAEAPKWSIVAEYASSNKTHWFTYQSALWSIAASAKVGESTQIITGISTFNQPYTRSTPAFFFELTHKFGR